MRVKYSDWLDIRLFYGAMFLDKKERRIKVHNTGLVTRQFFKAFMGKRRGTMTQETLRAYVQNCIMFTYYPVN